MHARRILLALAAIVLLWFAAAAYLFLRPRYDTLPAHADAVVVLAGDASYRIPAGLRLVRRGVASTLVLDREPERHWRLGPRLCAHGSPGIHVVCFTARPYSTRGEAEAVSGLARARHWRSLVVVTSGYHVTRARLLFRRCFHGRLAVTGVGYDRLLLPLDLVGETIKLVGAETFRRGC